MSGQESGKGAMVMRSFYLPRNTRKKKLAAAET